MNRQNTFDGHGENTRFTKRVCNGCSEINSKLLPISQAVSDGLFSILVFFALVVSNVQASAIPLAPCPYVGI